VLLTDFPDDSSVLASMFYRFEPDNDFAIALSTDDVTMMHYGIEMRKSQAQNTF
jgi:hypothetical protein